MKNKIKKLTKAEIIEYYNTLAYPERYNIDFVPADLRLKSFEKMILWMGCKEPETVKEDKKVQKMVFEVVVAKD